LSAIGDGACQALVGLHAFTECDSVSAFSGRWKARAALRKLKRDNNQQKAFGS